MSPNPQDSEYLVSFTDEIINGELHFIVQNFGISFNIEINVEIIFNEDKLI